MPNKLEKANKRIEFLADRLSILMVELVTRDCDYGDFCHDDFYKSEAADVTRETQHYKVALDLVRNMLRRHDNGMGTD